MGIPKKGKEYFFIFIALFLLTAVSIAINGYFFGEFGQGILLVFQRSLIDDTLYKNASVLGVRDYYFTYFFKLLTFPSKIFGIENVYFFSYFLSTYLLYLSVFFLAKALFKNMTVAYLSVVLLLVNKNIIGSETIFSAFFPRVVAFPFLLFSIYFFLNNRYIMSFAIIGLLTNIHITTASHMFLILMFCLLMNFRKIGLKRIIGYSALTFVLSLPTFIWTRMYSVVSLSPPKIWWDMINITLAHHLDPFSWGVFRWIQAFSYILVFFFALKYKPEREKHKKIMGMIFALIILSVVWAFFYYVLPLATFVSSTIWVSTKFVTVIVVIYLSNYIFQTYKKDIHFKIAITGLTTSLFLSNFKGMLLFTLLIAALSFRKNLKIFFILFISFLFLSLLSIVGSITPYLPYVYSLKIGLLPLIIIALSIILVIAYETFKRHIKKGIYQDIIFAGIFFIILASTLGGVLLLRKPLDVPRGAVFVDMMESYEYDSRRLPPVNTFSEAIKKPYNIHGRNMIRPITFSAILDLFRNPSDYIIHNVYIPNKIEMNDWRKVQVWVKENAGKDVIFITPPYLPDFKSFSERANVGEWDDLGVANHNINIGLQILEKVQALCGSRLIGECREGNCPDVCRANYNKFSEQDFLRLAKKYNAGYVIVEKPKLLSFRLVHENKGFGIYKVHNE